MGRVIGAGTIVRDLTDRLRAEAANARLAAIVESSNDAIIGKTLQGVITSWNRAAERMYGYSAHDAIGQSIAMLVPDERRVELAELLAQVAAGRSIPHLESVRRRRDGRLIEVSLTVSPIHDR